MNLPSPSMRDLARQLLAVEAAANPGRNTQGHGHEAVRVIERLRVSLARFAGPDGFASLLRRALNLAQAEVPALQSVTIKPDGSLEGLEDLVLNNASNGAAEALTTSLLGLLVTFIGKPLTLKLVQDAWLDADLNF